MWCGLRPGDAPDAPQRRRVGERVAVNEEEVRVPALADAARLGLAEDLAGPRCDCGECLPRLQTGLDECFDLPRKLVRTARAAAEVGAGAHQHARRVRAPDARSRSFPALADRLPSLRAREALDRRRAAEAGPGL